MTEKAKKPPRKTAAKVVDFDKVLAPKQRLVKRDLPKIKVGGKSYALCPTIPLAVTEVFAAEAENEDGETRLRVGDMKDMLEILFGTEAWAEIRKVVDEAALPSLFTVVFQAYGEALGESSGSGEN